MVLEQFSHLGVTLLYRLRTRDELQAIRKSYVIPICSSLQELETEAHRIAEREYMAALDGGESQVLVGIDDVFSVTGPPEPGQVLGRSTLWDCGSRADADEFVSDDPVISLPRFDGVSPWHLAKAVYFIDADADGDSYTAFANVLVRVDEPGEALAAAAACAGSAPVMRRLIGLGPETERNAEYVGLERLVPVRREIETSGAFDVLARTFSSINAIAGLVPDEQSVREDLELAAVGDAEQYRP